MCTDPEPYYPFFYIDTNRTVFSSHSHRPILSNFLQMQGWVLRIGFE
ncbi:MAG: hypothetical protein HFACDABA_02603 [Anaerolineales bacterium]|nr:hypothetical protein [Anaerolineales bacterium]